MKSSTLKTVLFASVLGLSLSVSAAAPLSTSGPTPSSSTNNQNPANTTTGAIDTSPGRSGANRITNTGDTLNPSRSTSTTTNPPLSTTPPGTLPMAQPQNVDPAVRNNEVMSEAQRRAQGQPFQGAETCAENDAACMRRRSEQLRRNTPFEYRTPPTPGSSTNPDGTLRQ